jgi:hypothetical protein
VSEGEVAQTLTPLQHIAGFDSESEMGPATSKMGPINVQMGP